MLLRVQTMRWGIGLAMPGLIGTALAAAESGVDLPVPRDARTIEFTTDEGTWISLDVAPDGRAIVFELLGDLYSLPIEGGTAQRITQGVAFDAQPRISPDGRWLAFVSDRSGENQLWIARPDGSQPRLLSSGGAYGISPAWLPDSRYVVASADRLMLFDIDGGSGIPLTVGDSAQGPASPAERVIVRGAVASADGQYLYFARRLGQDTAYSRSDFQIHRRDMRSGEVQVLTSRLGGAFRPALSPDGRQMVYATRHENQTGLRILDLEGGADRWLRYPVQRDNTQENSSSNRDVFPGYAFTPDGRALIVTLDGRIQRIAIEDGRATAIPFTAQVSLQIGPSLEVPYRIEDGAGRARLILSPRQSPDGRQLTFSALAQVYVMDLPGGTPRRLTRESEWEYQPVWSPDGRWIAYVSWSEEGGHIWKMRADGRGKPRRLTQRPAYYPRIEFFPDGTRIVALSGSAQIRREIFRNEDLSPDVPLELIWLPADGGTAHRVAPATGLHAPHFSSDPQRIYLHEGGTENLLSMRFDGSDRRTHLRLESNPEAQAALLSPDGRWALARLDKQLYLIPVPQVGGEGAAFTLAAPQLAARRLTSIGPDYFAWADEGRTITWAIGSTFFRRSLASALEDDNVEAAERIEVNVEFARARPRGIVALRHATVITMEGETIFEDGDIVIRDNRIAAVGRGGEVTIPAGAQVLDLRGRYIVPGFIDTHAHWKLLSRDVLEPSSWDLAANLAYGVTTGLDVQAPANTFVYQDLAEAGRIVGQRVLTTGPGVMGYNTFKSYAQMRDYLRRYAEHYRTRNLKSYNVGGRQQRLWMAQACRELGLMPTTEGAGDLRMNLTHALDGFHGNEHALPASPLYRDVVELFARSRIAYTPTLLVQYDMPQALDHYFETENVHEDAKLNRFVHHNLIDLTSRRRVRWARTDEYVYAEAARQAAKIQRAGGLMGVGSHGELPGLGYHWEMWSLGAGMTPREVLRAATIDGARIVGVAQDLGSIAVGKIADLVVLDGNPLENIRHTNTVRHVMKNGVLYEGDTLRQLWPNKEGQPSHRTWDRP